MDARRRVSVLAATALTGLAAAIWHTGVNYQWRDGQWSPPAPWLVPLAAALPPIAIYLGLRELFRKDGRKLAAVSFTALALFAVLIALTPILISRQSDRLGGRVAAPSTSSG